MTIVGEPTWTSGHFTRTAAQDDLGIEALGAGMLRELVPGVVQTSISAGYYAYYPFLLDEFERQSPNELERSVFRQYYRRQEAAFAVACAQHEHRGNLRGINGVNGATAALSSVPDSGLIDIAELAKPGRYMKTPLGGYGLFYRPALEDIGATRLGAGNKYVDRPTDLGRRASAAFREVVEQTEYWQRWRESDAVPVEVLAELGGAVCPCCLPGRADQGPVIDLLFRARGENERWEQLRDSRVKSFGLLLEFHEQRDDAFAGIGAWRRALVSGSFGDKEWSTSFTDQREAWRAYQHREIVVAALTTLFSNILLAIDWLHVASPGQAASYLSGEVDWDSLPTNAADPLGQLVDAFQQDRDEPSQLVELAEQAMASSQPASLSESVTTTLRLIASLSSTPEGDEEFEQLLERGGPERLSVMHVSGWLSVRREQAVGDVLEELLRHLFHRHLRIATLKLTATDHRDPYCVAEQNDGSYSRIRGDQPFWTGARFATLNHLLWTAGLFDDPDGNGRLTQLGHQLLKELRDG